MSSVPLLTEKNFLIYSAQNYNNPSCQDVKEFHDDIRRIKYIKKLITRYKESGNLKERLILNHLIILGNIFPPEVLVRILYLKMSDQMMYLKPFLLLLSFLPKYIQNVGKIGVVDTEHIPLDQGIVDKLRKI